MKSHIKDNCTKIVIDERFTFDNFHEFKEVTYNITTQKIEIDFFKTEYIDSAALGMLLVLRDSHRDTCLKNAKDNVKKIFEIANFHKLFEMT